ncbi:alpha/beta hydrolase fold domain-containing protein [Lactobacillus sp. S2-2]|uniref:alpha/beta hydrolase n=1 Tax=Lactobacillus sp. S2-2 TaxID=2692917 RepID=UPI001F4288EE|nr:alpha/beta hydrolase [Lactobacillus sp. S2-2]MCF6515403.1 alpha/beta hydrolase fold domain-containing protein [Lactobacillus sp. S2-2]
MKFIERDQKFVPADTDWINNKWIDVSYADGKRRKMDIYLPNEDKEQFPVIIDIFGGGMYFGQKSSFKLQGALELLKKGYAVVSPNYSLSHQADFPTPIYEIKAAIRYIKAHAKDFKINPKQVFLMGESSGAQLAMLTAASIGSNQLNGELGDYFDQDLEIKGVIASYGPYNLKEMPFQFKALGQEPRFTETGASDSFEGVMLKNNRPIDVPELNDACNPASYLTDKMVPVLFYAGLDDHVAPYVQTVNLATQVMEKIGEQNVQVHLVAGADHGPKAFLSDSIYQEKDEFMRKLI